MNVNFVDDTLTFERIVYHNQYLSDAMDELGKADALCALVVVRHALELAPGHCPLAVAVAHKTLEGIIILLSAGILFAASDAILSQCKFFLGHNGFMRSLGNDRIAHFLRETPVFKSSLVGTVFPIGELLLVKENHRHGRWL